ncbi:hypothetical protein [Enterococcus larvae]|uniref:hypothetical protein n=1 Tax=Enterococcus larvae TaxID=2794352 RepID=UPI003F3F8A3F
MTIAEAINDYFNNKEYKYVMITYKLSEGELIAQVKINEPVEMNGNFLVLTEKNNTVHLFPQENLIQVLAVPRK